MIVEKQLILPNIISSACHLPSVVIPPNSNFTTVNVYSESPIAVTCYHFKKKREKEVQVLCHWALYPCWDFLVLGSQASSLLVCWTVLKHSLTNGWSLIQRENFFHCATRWLHLLVVGEFFAWYCTFCLLYAVHRSEIKEKQEGDCSHL